MSLPFTEVGMVPTPARYDECVPLGCVAEEDLIILKQRGYICPTARAVAEAAIARIILGEINLKDLPDWKLKLKVFTDHAGHNKVSIKVIDRMLATPKFLTKTLPGDLQILADLKYHPNIALPYDYFQNSMHIYLVSESCLGVSVTTYMVAKGHKERYARSVFSQISSAVTHVHEHGILHRNLTPVCITVNQHGYVKIQDFGLSPKLTAVQPSLLHERTKRAYMAPEVIKSRRYERKEADIYSMGIVLYEMLHGNVPYVGYKNDILIQIFLRDLKFRSTIAREVQSLIRQMLHPDPWKRPKAYQCLDHLWTCELSQPKPARSKKPQVNPYSQKDWIDCKVSMPCQPKYDCVEQWRACAQATVACGSEKVVLRSRIPNKWMAYAMDMDYADMCTQLQSNVEARLEQNLSSMLKYPKPFCQLPLPTSTSDRDQCLSPDTLNSYGRMASQEAVKDAERDRAQMGDLLHVKPITKPPIPDIPSPDDSETECVSDNVFGSRPASAESDQSVFSVDQDDCKLSSADGTERGSDISINKEAEDNNRREVANTGSQDQTVSRDIQQSQAEVVTQKSYESERGSPVPSDVGSMEPEMDFQQRKGVNGQVTMTERENLPPISTEERVLRFLSDISVTNRPCSSTSPPLHFPSPCPVLPQTRVSHQMSELLERKRKYVVNQTSRWAFRSGLSDSDPGVTKQPPKLPRVNGRLASIDKVIKGAHKLEESASWGRIAAGASEVSGRCHPASITTSPLCISHKQWAPKPLAMQVRGKRAEPLKPEVAGENLDSLPGPLYNSPLRLRPLRIGRPMPEALHSLLQVSAANVAQYQAGVAPTSNTLTKPQFVPHASSSSDKLGSTVTTQQDEAMMCDSLSEFNSSRDRTREVQPIQGKRVRSFVKERVKLPAAQLTFFPQQRKDQRFAGWLSRDTNTKVRVATGIKQKLPPKTPARVRVHL